MLVVECVFCNTGRPVSPAAFDMFSGGLIIAFNQDREYPIISFNCSVPIVSARFFVKSLPKSIIYPISCPVCSLP